MQIFNCMFNSAIRSSFQLLEELSSTQCVRDHHKDLQGHALASRQEKSLVDTTYRLNQRQRDLIIHAKLEFHKGQNKPLQNFNSNLHHKWFPYYHNSFERTVVRHVFWFSAFFQYFMMRPSNWYVIWQKISIRSHKQEGKTSSVHLYGRQCLAFLEN